MLTWNIDYISPMECLNHNPATCLDTKMLRRQKTLTKNPICETYLWEIYQAVWVIFRFTEKILSLQQNKNVDIIIYVQIFHTSQTNSKPYKICINSCCTSDTAHNIVNNTCII